jgi:hypothetical protein
MGTKYLCKCSGCDLTAEVCNGPSAGFQFECTTIWCDDCRELSDATTSALGDMSFIVPPAKVCPACSDGQLVPLNTRKCPRCQTKYVYDDKDTFITAKKCPDCSFATRYAVRPTIQEDSTIIFPMVCGCCYSVSVETFRQPGAWARYSKYTDYKLSCGLCESANVREWTNVQPCPKCGGSVSVSEHPVEFFD